MALLSTSQPLKQMGTDPRSSPTPQGKLNTEDLLQSRGLNWTSVRPVYIYGPLNYNPVEEWFFQRLAAGRPIPVPNSGQQVGRPCSLPANVGSHYQHFLPLEGKSRFFLRPTTHLQTSCSSLEPLSRSQMLQDNWHTSFCSGSLLCPGRGGTHVVESQGKPFLVFLLQVTQLGHVKDLATAFKLMLGNEKAKGQIYNISGERCE